MKIVVVVIVIFFLFKYLKARYEFSKIREKGGFYLKQAERMISDSPNDPLNYAHRGSLHMKLQDLPQARNDFRKALVQIEKGFPLQHEGLPVANKEEIVKHLLLNIKYTEKPLPWSKNCPKDYSRSAMFYFLVDRFGDLRYNF